MATYRIKLFAIDSADAASMRSILALADPRLNSQWTIEESAQPDLSIYGYDSSDGQQLLLNHRGGVCAALSQQKDPKNNADIQLRRPLRAKQLVEALNNAEKIIVSNRQQPTIPQPMQGRDNDQNVSADVGQPENPTSSNRSTKRESLFGSISKRLLGKKSPAKDLPSLSLYVPESSMNSASTILDPKMLSSWIANQSHQDPSFLASNLREKLSVLNRTEHPPEQRLVLLETYRHPISNLFFRQDIQITTSQLIGISGLGSQTTLLSACVEELSLGYKRTLMDAYQSGARPKNNDVFLFSIIRATESLSLLILDAYRHYLPPPTSSINELHQLYIYCEAAAVLDKKVKLNLGSSGKAFIDYYSQMMLTCIADPYRLEEYEVFQLFHFIAKFADKITVAHLNQAQKGSDERALLGHFGLDCAGDDIPMPLHHMEQLIRQNPVTRIFNLQGVLFSVDKLLASASRLSATDASESDVELLQRVAPYFNPTYQRPFQKIPTTKPVVIDIAVGIQAIHDCLTSSSTVESMVSKWTMTHQETDKIKLVNTENQHSHKVGDIVVLFHRDTPPIIAVIYSLYQDPVIQSTELALQLKVGIPHGAELIIQNQSKQFHCLILSEDNVNRTLLTPKGAFGPNRLFNLAQDNDKGMIKAGKLLNHSNSYEQFGFEYQY